MVKIPLTHHFAPVAAKFSLPPERSESIFCAKLPPRCASRFWWSFETRGHSGYGQLLFPLQPRLSPWCRCCCVRGCDHYESIVSTATRYSAKLVRIVKILRETWKTNSRRSLDCPVWGKCDECTVRNVVTSTSEAPLEHTTAKGSGTTTLETLSVGRGYWRATNENQSILPYYHADACIGSAAGCERRRKATIYAKGYWGPMETEMSAFAS